MNFAELVGAQSYVAGNVGTSEAREMAEWVEYMTSPTGSSLASERAANGRVKPWTVDYFGIGNELWGCGGNMRPEYAADITRRYAAFLKVPSGSAKIASGANADDYNWTEVMMREAGKYINGFGVHYYTIPGTWSEKGSASRFDEAQYAATIARTLKMDELLTRHSAIMDKYDPEKHVALLVDEWGTWFDVEPGTNPGFLYQQNSVRDALVAAINLNIFAAHAERVKGANIAQMVNVLQAMILTKDEKMVRTPTYHVFDMYKAYQDATVLPVTLSSPWYNKDQWTVPVVSASAVRDAQGVVHVGLTNVDPSHPVVVTLTLDNVQAATVSGRVLTGPAVNSINTFDQPDLVVPAAFSGASLSGKTLTVTMPPHAVVMLDVR
jgi:alpha-N-arabinofuranosidase